jgi:hypothetical protein
LRHNRRFAAEIPNNFQTSTFKRQAQRFVSLGFEIYELFGAWVLGFGISLPAVNAGSAGFP